MSSRWTRAPFALFVLATTNVANINAVLEAAQSQPGLSSPVLWLATAEYDNAPRNMQNRTNQGTTSPISESYGFPFSGWRLENVVKWLQRKPAEVDLDASHFAIMDRRSARDASLIVCKIGDKNLECDSVDYRRYTARRGSTLLRGLEYGEWEEIHRKPTDTRIEYE